MRTSITVTNFSWPSTDDIDPIVSHLDTVASLTDTIGIDSLFVSDHLLQLEPGAEPDEPMLEASSTLAYLAARTTNVRLGAMVAPASLRPPALLVKAVTTLDVLSGGRAWFGVGAGYHGDEADQMGLPLPPTAERFDRLEDTLRLARQMWADDTEPFLGTAVHASHPISAPAPRSVPHPPILIGGTGERRTLRLVARHADACNLPDLPDGGAQIRHKLDVLARHCATEGRDPAEIETTVSTRLAHDDTADTFVTRARDLAALGVEHLIVLTQGPWTTESLDVLAAAVPATDAIESTTRTP